MSWPRYAFYSELQTKVAFTAFLGTTAELSGQFESLAPLFLLIHNSPELVCKSASNITALIKIIWNERAYIRTHLKSNQVGASTPIH